MVEILRARRGPITLVGIKIEPEEPFVLVGETKQLAAQAKPKAANRGAITWSGGSSTTVSIDENGVITGQKAESRVSVTARSDAGFTDWVYARCGYDVTDIAFEADTLTIEGIQGVLFGLTSTPSNATEISYTSISEDGSIAGYYISSKASERRMWGYGVGSTVVTAMGRSGNAEYPCAVTVNPVGIEGIEVRDYTATTTTEQGDAMPTAKISTATMIVGSDWDMRMFFFPFNTTQRIIKAESSDTSVATVDARNGEAPIFDRAYGVARRRNARVSALEIGETTITLTPEHGDPYIIELKVVNAGDVYGTASTSGSTATMARITFTFKVNDLVGSIRASGSSTNWTGGATTRTGKTMTRTNYKSDGGKSASGTWWAIVDMRDGTTRQISTSASWSA